MTRESATLLTLILYKLVLLGIGFFAHRKNRDSEDFFLGGRQLSPLVAAISASASSSSAWTLLGVSGAAYAWGLSAIWLWPACVGGFIFNWYVLAPRVQTLSRERGALTLTDLISGPSTSPWHPRIKGLCSVIIVFSFTVYIASQFDGAGKTFHETFGLPTAESILIGAGVIVLYTLLGGFWAVSLTDTLQGIVMAVTALVLPLAALQAVGGWGGFTHGLNDLTATEGLAGFTNAFNKPGSASVAGFILGTLGIGFGYAGQPHVVNRFMALVDAPRAVSRARVIAVGWSVIVYTGMLLLGWCGRILFTSLNDSEVIFIAAANHLFPPVFSGVMLAAVLSAIMSTADSQLLVAGSALTHDLGWGGDKPKTMIFRSRVVIFLISAVAAIAAIQGPQDIFSRVLFAWTAMGSAFGPLLIAQSFRRVVPSKRRFAAILLGALLSITAYSIPATKGGVFERMVPFGIGLLICFWPTAPSSKTAVRSPDA